MMLTTYYNHDAQPISIGDTVTRRPYSGRFLVTGFWVGFNGETMADLMPVDGFHSVSWAVGWLGKVDPSLGSLQDKPKPPPDNSWLTP